MRVAFESFWLQKAGSRPDEYEDAFAPPAVEDGARAEFLCAVADGATETSFSGLWAQILVDAFAGKRLNHLRPDRIDALAGEWQAEIGRRTRDKPLPWYAEEKLRAGAFSSLIGLYLREDRTWGAVCVGDSCLFQVRPRQSIRAFPFHTPEQFTNRPTLISTNSGSNHAIGALLTRGEWQEGDCFLLMTDALAHFFLSYRAARARLLTTPLSQADFERLIAAARRKKLCRNDDVTLLVVRPSLGEPDGGVA